MKTEKTTLKNLSKELIKFSIEEKVKKISNKKMMEDISIAFNNILTIGSTVSEEMDYNGYFEDDILTDKNISDIAHDVAVERGEDKDFGICFYKDTKGLNYIFVATNDRWQIEHRGNINL